MEGAAEGPAASQRVWRRAVIIVLAYALLVRLCVGLHPYSGKPAGDCKRLLHVMIPNITLTTNYLYTLLPPSLQEWAPRPALATSRPSATGWRSQSTPPPRSGELLLEVVVSYVRSVPLQRSAG